MPSQSIGLTPKSTKNRAENSSFWYAIKLLTFSLQLNLFYNDTYSKKISITLTTGFVSFCLYIVSKGLEEIKISSGPRLCLKVSLSLLKKIKSSTCRFANLAIDYEIAV